MVVDIAVVVVVVVGWWWLPTFHIVVQRKRHLADKEDGEGKKNGATHIHARAKAKQTNNNNNRYIQKKRDARKNYELSRIFAGIFTPRFISEARVHTHTHTLPRELVFFMQGAKAKERAQPRIFTPWQNKNNITRQQTGLGV